MLKKIKDIIKLFNDMFVILNKKQKRNCAMVFFFILLGGFMEVLGVSAVLPVIEVIINPKTIKAEPLYIWITGILHLDTDKEFILVASTGVVFLYLIKNIYLTFSTYVQSKLVADIRSTMSEKTIRAYLKNEYPFFVNENSAVVLRGLTTDIDSFLSTFQNFFNIGVRLVNVIFICSFLMYTDFLLSAVVVFLGIVAMGIVTGTLKKHMRSLGILQRNASAELLKNISQLVAGIKEVKVLNRNEFFIKRYDSVVKNKGRIDVKYNTLISCPERVIETVFIGGMLLTVGVLAYIGKADNKFVANLSVFAVACFRLLPFVSQLSGCVNSMMYNYAAVKALVDNLNGVLNKTYQEIAYDRIETFEDMLRLDDVSFSYGENMPDVLKHITLNIRKGDSIALVGQSGAGKTTLADIILGLNRIDSGRIIVDGRTVNFGEKTWGRLIGYVSQNIFLLDDSILNNIAFGCSEDEIDMKRIQDVVKQAQLDEFILSLPNGLETNVGEAGAKISGGQRQRIAIARALYFDPEILILDEATSALDNDTERAVMDAIDILKLNKTLIIVAHRLSTIEKCNHVYEIKKCSIYERPVNENAVI